MTFKVEPSNFKLLSHVNVLASPPTLVRMELFVAFETRGTLRTSAASDVLRLPETIGITMFPLTSFLGRILFG